MECSGGLPRQEGTREPTDDEELIARLRAAIRRYRQIGGPPRLKLVVDGMRVVIEDQHLGWNWPSRDPE
jgi:hypothetical protein